MEQVENEETIIKLYRWKIGQATYVISDDALTDLSENTIDTDGMSSNQISCVTVWLIGLEKNYTKAVYIPVMTFDIFILQPLVDSTCDSETGPTINFSKQNIDNITFRKVPLQMRPSPDEPNKIYLEPGRWYCTITLMKNIQHRRLPQALAKGEESFRWSAARFVLGHWISLLFQVTADEKSFDVISIDGTSDCNDCYAQRLHSIIKVGRGFGHLVPQLRCHCINKDWEQKKDLQCGLITAFVVQEFFEAIENDTELIDGNGSLTFESTDPYAKIEGDNAVLPKLKKFIVSYCDSIENKGEFFTIQFLHWHIRFLFK